METNFSELELITLAISMEEEGVKFYTDYAKKTTGELKEILLGLADDEKRHVHIFQKMYDEMKKGQESEEYLFDENVKEYFHSFAKSEAFSREPKVVSTVKGALLVGVETEKATVDYYKNLMKYIQGDAKDVLGRMIKEEVSHMERLKELYDNYQE
ncbi:ferritin-like domain-containing protein [Anaerotalea alkaliphila]|uniref:Ferritin family protein n=1 Tax=Anaerotalea alkaliphila TaxID=2662126 RepID=A0A7X5HTB3_9FIRM|nr:ferritin family protein [Anaerotalea alkaliphila]NDL66175.1 ferritin family protein [Anaerotalea alkaliphila]